MRLLRRLGAFRTHVAGQLLRVGRKPGNCQEPCRDQQRERQADAFAVANPAYPGVVGRLRAKLSGRELPPPQPELERRGDVVEEARADVHVRRRMDAIDLVIVLCGEYAHRASGVAAELSIAQEKSKQTESKRRERGQSDGRPAGTPLRCALRGTHQRSIRPPARVSTA